MLILLQPGIEPLGQFDLEDDDTSLVVGGEVGVFQALTVATDAYAADVFEQGPFTTATSPVHVTLDRVAADGELYGLVDEGTSTSTGTGYGTLFGTVIGAVAGQGTGHGEQTSTGTVVVGPATVRGSGKVTLWTKPGLYGVTSDAWTSTTEYDAAALNGDVFGDAADGTNDGKLTTTSSGNGSQVALFVGRMKDVSLVSTTTTAAGAESLREHAAIYLLGVQK